MLLLMGIGAFVADKSLDKYRDIANEFDMKLVGEKEEMSFIHDRNSQEIGTMFVENRFSIPLEEIPPIFVNAVLAQEDQRFYKHNGVDWQGVARAVYLNVKSRSITQGAGTITMQLARKSFDLLGEAKRQDWSGYERKIIEAMAAIRIEEHISDQLRTEYIGDDEGLKMAVKAVVLEHYLNLVPFGSGYYGVRSAALGYFGKEPKDLSISECASIVACLKNPSRISPTRSLEENKKNRDHVIRRMALEEMITDTERDKMIARPVVLNQKPILRGKSYLYKIIADQARELVGEEALSRGGYTIRTTIDAAIQDVAEKKLKEHLLKVERVPGYEHKKLVDYKKSQGSPKYLQGATLMMDHETGEVLAHVGGREYAHSQYDFIESGRRPLGTGFFPFVYASAFDNGYHPATMVMDQRLDARKLQIGGDLVGVVGEWGMEVLNPEYKRAQITSRKSLVLSKIAATVELGKRVGLSQVAKTADGFGLDIPTEPLLNRMLVGFDQVSLPEVTMAYSAFPRGGTRVSSRRYILEIRDIEGRVVYPLEEHSQGVVTKPACSSAAAFQVHSVLNEVLHEGNLGESTQGLTKSLMLGGGKSGTPYGFSDAWMVGYNSRITCSVWVGFYQGGRKAIHNSAFAKDVSYPIWEAMMNASQPSFEGEEILMPDSIERVPVCRVSGMRPTRYCNEPVTDPVTGELSFPSTSYQEFLRKGEELGICSVHGGGIDLVELANKVKPHDAIDVVPIRSVAPLLLGKDPYNSETPTLVPEDETAQWSSDEGRLVVEDRVEGEREALLTVPRPPRFLLPKPNVQDLLGE